MKQYVGQNGLTYLMTLIKDKLKTKVETTDSRLSDARVPTKHGSTHAKGATDEIDISTYNVTLKDEIVDNLTSTDTNKPLSANQGKILADMIGNAGYGDMLASTYDQDGDGVVDNAQKLNGKSDTDFDEAGAAADAKQDILNTIGQPAGIAPLDSNGKIDAQYLPGFVDDVIEGYFHNSSFYKDEEHITLITPEKDKLYVDIPNNKVYRWSGSTYVAISGSDDMLEITNAEILASWNTIFDVNE